MHTLGAELPNVSLPSISHSRERFLTVSYHMRRTVALALDHDFVMHALLMFAASQMAWRTKSTETANLARHHSGVALSGLHRAIGEFSQENSDAALAASLLLRSQAPDW